MTTLEDRERMRQEFQGLAELARDNGADSSGYVDLSAFAANDPNWVDHALAGRPSQPSKIDRLEAQSMAPIALESLVDTEGNQRVARSARLQRAFIVMSSACIAGLSALTIALVVRSAHPSAPTRVAAAAPVAVAAAAPAAVDPTPAAAAPVADAPPAAADTPAPAAAAPVAVAPAAHKPTRHSYAAPAPQTRTPHARTSSGGGGSNLAKSRKSSGGTDPLMAAIQQSMAKK